MEGDIIWRCSARWCCVIRQELLLAEAPPDVMLSVYMKPVADVERFTC